MLQLVKKCSWCKKPIYPDREICKSWQKDYDNGLLNKDGKPIVELYRAIGTLKSNEDKQT